MNRTWVSRLIPLVLLVLLAAAGGPAGLLLAFWGKALLATLGVFAAALVGQLGVVENFDEAGDFILRIELGEAAGASNIADIQVRVTAEGLDRGVDQLTRLGGGFLGEHAVGVLFLLLRDETRNGEQHKKGRSKQRPYNSAKSES